ncbi:hypothetical protein D6C89_05121 [Aureobasidium pullulans]|nr:hypothetical protein D6C89_05121 [Aureobasidium pullulans]
MDIQSDNMRSQEGLVKAIIVHDGSISGDGVKGKVEISKFEDMASYNWTKTSVPTASLGHKLSPYGTPLSMSGSTSLVALPEKQPGKPLQWSPPISGQIKLSLGPKTSYRDFEHSRGPKYAMEDSVRCITTADRGFISSEVDIFTSEHTLKRLIKFVQGDTTTFRLLVQKVNGTLFLAEKDKEAQTDLDLGRSFQSAYMKWPNGLTESVSHQRFVRYDFDGLQCLIRFEADGCLAETDRLMAAALISDLVHADSSLKLTPPALQMNLHASTLDLANAFCSELSEPPAAVSGRGLAGQAPTPEYHWSQAEALAEEAGRKQRIADEERAMEEERAMKAQSVSNLRNPQRQNRRLYQQPPPNPPIPASTKQSATSPVVQHNLYLRQYPLVRFRSITEAELSVIREHLNMAEGEFQRALWLYYNPQGPATEPRSENSASLLHRLMAATKIKHRQAKRYLVLCSNDYDKALRLNAAKKEYFREKRLRRDPKKVPGDEARYLRLFKQKEKEREAEVRRLQVARQKEKDKMVPHSALCILHCAPEKSSSTPVKLCDDEFIRLWITRIPSVITAYYDTKATVSSITYTDTRSQVRDWESNNQDTLTKLSTLLKDIKQTLEESEKSKVILHIVEKHKMEIREAGKEEKDVLSEYMTNTWLNHARDEEPEEDARNMLNATTFNSIADEGEEEEEGEAEEEEQEQEYVSDESSDWSREYEDSDDDEGDGLDKKK